MKGNKEKEINKTSRGERLKGGKESNKVEKPRK